MAWRYHKCRLEFGFCLMFLVGLCTGCTTSHSHSTEDSKLGPTYILYSPNGEPLNGASLGRPTCQQALSTWFDRIDTNHDGLISHSEFMADATTQFRQMDIDKNGYLLPEELERYRLPYRQDINPIPEDFVNSSSSNTTGDHNDHSKIKDESRPSAALDPVMSADTNNDFRVTSKEFEAQAERLFNNLDTHHNGLVERKDVLATSCPIKKQDHQSKDSWLSF